MSTTVELPDRLLSPAKRSLVEKRLRGAFQREGCSWRKTASRRRGSAIIPLQPHGSRHGVLLVHGAGGGLLWGYRNLAAQLGHDQPVYALEPRSLQHWRSLRTVEEMALAYLDELREFQPRGPYYLGGYCFGGLLAYELARQLWLRCERVGALILIDAAAPNGGYQRLPWWRPGFLCHFARNLFYWAQDFRHLEARARHNLVRRKLGSGVRKLLRGFRSAATTNDALDLEKFIDPRHFPDDELELWRIHLRAELDYHPRPYPGRLILLRTRGQPMFCSFDPLFGWGELAGGVTVRALAGAHERIFETPYVETLAQVMRSCLTGNSQAESTELL